jgi:osmotically-inducible protein OsmY
MAAAVKITALAATLLLSHASAAEEEVAARVQAALRADPYFLDSHVQVSLEHGAVVLRGLVYSDWDLRDALRIASRAAGGRQVVDCLTLIVGGRR